MTTWALYHRMCEDLDDAAAEIAAIRAGLDALDSPPIARPSSSAPALRRRAGHQTEGGR